jgi:pSer/pThr/pTyr-binding forkhead associated (FHA) protein
MLAFLIMEPAQRAAELNPEGGSDLVHGVLLLGLVFGGIVAALLAAADEAPSGSPLRMFTRGTIAGLLGALIGLAASIAANILYAILHLFAMVGGLGFQIIARTAGWALFGAGIGIAAGLLSRSHRRVVQGCIGGLLGGSLGGFLFDLVALSTHSETATLSRLIGFTAVAACVGLATALVEELGRTAWITFLSGAREGRQVILHRDMVLGRDELVDIPLFGDPTVSKRQAEIVLTPSPYIRETSESPLLRVDGHPVREAQLADGSLIELGRHRFHFHHRALAGATGAPLPGGPTWSEPVRPASPPRPAPVWLGEAPPEPAYATAPLPADWPQPLSATEGAGPVLRITAGPNAGTVIALHYDVCTLGRELDNTIPLADRRMSRYHAQITYREEEETWVLEDRGSTNGTVLNGLRITRAALAPGDVIQVGETLISVEAPSTHSGSADQTLMA